MEEESERRDREPMTYSKAGVDIDREEESIRAMLRWLERTREFRRGKIGDVLGPYGHFANLVDLGGDLALAIKTDGVGSKVLIAQMMDSYRGIGIDLVAMNVNDIICVGAEPIAMVDYYAVDIPNPRISEELARGIYEGAREAEIAVVGGETASLPDMIIGVERGKAFDIAATCIGIVEKDRIITGERIEEGDSVIGIESSGIHSNGLTLARKVLLSKYSPWDEIDGIRIGEELLKPTRIYVRPIKELLRELDDVRGLAHITGGGFLKLARIGTFSGIGFILDDMPEPQPIFRLIMKEGNVPLEEMYRTFNMGIGFCVVVPKRLEDEALQILNKHYPARRIGFASRRIEGGSTRIVLEGGRRIIDLRRGQ